MADTIPLRVQKDVDAFGEAFRTPSESEPHDPFAKDRLPGTVRNNSVRWQEMGHQMAGVTYSPDGALRIESNGRNRTFSARGYEPGSVLSLSTADGQTSGITFTDAMGTASRLELRKLQDVRYGDPQYIGAGWSAKRMVGPNGSESFRIWYNDAPGTAQEGIREGRSISVDLETRNGRLVPTFIHRREGLRSIELPPVSGK
jgi:hypothetical protein